jgi:hypothetical protein
LTRDVIRGATIEPLWWHNHGPQYYLRGPLTLDEARALRSFIVYEQLIAAQLARASPGLERDILEDLHVLVRLQILAGRQRELLPRCINPQIQCADRAAQRELGDWCVEQFQTIAKIRARQWKRYRAGLEPDNSAALCRQRANELRRFLRDLESTPAESRAMLSVKLYLHDSYSAPLLRIELREGTRWRQVFVGNFKPVNHRDALYALQVPVTCSHGDPDRVRFSVSGFGGQGIAYASLHFRDHTLVPSAVASAHGQVTSPIAVLTDDSRVCYLGFADTAWTLEHRLDREESSIEITFASQARIA